MLLRESNDNRRTDLAIQQRILASAPRQHASPQPLPSSSVQSDRAAVEGEKTGAGIHARRTSSSSSELGGDGGGTAETDAVETKQGEQVVVPEPSGRNRGQDPGDTGGRSICSIFDLATLHGEPWLAGDDSEQFADLACAVPPLERSYSCFRFHPSSDADRGDESAADGEAEPDNSQDSTQLPAEASVHLVSL